MQDKDYIVVVQCHLVKQRCSGYQCEQAFNSRSGGFDGLAPDRPLRSLHLSCGGCCGRALHRKLGNLVRKLKAKEKVERDRILVKLSSCITKDNYHGPPCPHLAYIKQLVAKLGLDVSEDTVISATASKRREQGRYRS